MKKTLILLAGYPATGKSFLCNKICSRYPEFRILSQDELKEALWDEYGFDNMEEKTARESRLSRIIRSVTSRRTGSGLLQKKTTIRSLHSG